MTDQIPAAPSRPTQAEHSWTRSGMFFDDVPIREDREQDYEVFSVERNSYPKEPGQLTFDETVWRYNGPLGGVKLIVTDIPHESKQIHDERSSQLHQHFDWGTRDYFLLVHRDHPWTTNPEEEASEDGRYYAGPFHFDFAQLTTFDAKHDGLRLYGLLQSAYRLQITQPVVEVDPAEQAQA